MSKFDEIREHLQRNRKTLSRAGAGIYEGVSSVVPSILNAERNPFEKELEDYKDPESLDEFLQEAEAIADETRRRNEEGRVLSAEETEALLGDLDVDDSTPSQRKSKRKKSSKASKKKGKSKTRLALAGATNISKEDLDRLNSPKKLTLKIKSTEGGLLESSFRRIEAGLVSLAKINTAGFSALAAQVVSHQQIVSYGAGLRAHNLQQLIKAANNIGVSSTKDSLFSLTSNKGMDDYIRSNLNAAFYLEKLTELYQNEEGMLGSAKKVMEKPVKSLLQAAIKEVDKEYLNGTMAELNDTVKNLPAQILSQADEGQFDPLKEKYLSAFYRVPLVGKLLQETNADSFIKDKFFGGKSLDEMLDPEQVDRVDKGTQVAFDAETHNSLNVVIPGYLGEIYKSLTGVTLVHDYSSGKWKTQKEFMEEMRSAGEDRLASRNSKLVETLNLLDLDDDTKKQLLYDIVDQGLDTPAKLSILKEKYAQHGAEIGQLQELVNESVLRSEVRLGRMVLRQEKEGSIKGTSLANLFNKSQSLVDRSPEGAVGSLASPALPTTILGHLSETTLDILEMLRARTGPKSYEDFSNLLEGVFGPKPAQTGESLVLPNSTVAQGEPSTLSSMAEVVDKFVPEDSKFKGLTSSLATSTAAVGGQSLQPESTNPVVSAVTKVSDGVETYQDTLETVDAVSDIVEKINPDTADKLRGISGTFQPGALKTKFMSSSLGTKLQGTKDFQALSSKSSSIVKLTGDFSKAMSKGKAIPGTLVEKLMTKGSSFLGSSATLGKLGNGVIGKMASKIGIKGAGKMLGAVSSPVGWAITAVTILPDVVNLLKDPMAALRHPFQALGSLIGLTEAPTSSQDDKALGVEASTAEHAAKKEGGGLLGGLATIVGGAATLALVPAIMLGSTLLGIKGMYQKYTTAGQLSSVDPTTANRLMMKAKEYSRNEEELAKRSFDNTVVGSLYNLASGKTKKSGELSRFFHALFSAFGGGGTSTINIQTQTLNGGSSPGDSTSTNGGGTSTAKPSSPSGKAKGGTGGNSTGTPSTPPSPGGSSGGSTGGGTTPNPAEPGAIPPKKGGSSGGSTNPLQPSLPKAGKPVKPGSSVPKGGGAPAPSTPKIPVPTPPDAKVPPITDIPVPPPTTSQVVPKDINPGGSTNPIIQLIIGGTPVTFPESVATVPTDPKGIQYIINNAVNSLTNITNNYFDRSSDAVNTAFDQTEEGQRFLIMKDILALTDSLGTDILEMGDHFLSILDRVTKTTDKQETSNDLAEDRVAILTSLATMSALI